MTVVAIPEPGSLALLGMGVLSLVGMVLRRRRTSFVHKVGIACMDKQKGRES